MKAMHNKAVLRETIVEENVAATIKTIRTHSNSPRAFLRTAAVIIPLVALSYLSISQQERINSIYTQMATLNPFAPTEIIGKAIENIPEKVLEIEVETNLITKVIEREIAPVIILQKRYYIIAGAFAVQNNANKMLKKLNSSNYNAEILEEGSLLRVSYDSFNTREEALLVLNEIRQENQDAWLLTK